MEKAIFVDTALRAEIDALLESCSAADGVSHEIYTDSSINAHKDMACAFSVREGGKLSGFLFVFAPGKDDAEIVAFVHPQARGRGLFRTMLQAAKEECGRFGYNRGFLVCNEASAVAVCIMEGWKLPLDHAEYQMRLPVASPAPAQDPGLRLERMQPVDIPTVAPLMAECFGQDAGKDEAYLAKSLATPDREHWILKRQDQAIGFCGVYREGSAFNLFGIGILPAERGKGYARRMLDLVANLALDNAASELKLDVDSTNAEALRLYRAYGFEKTSATNYYEILF